MNSRTGSSQERELAFRAGHLISSTVEQLFTSVQLIHDTTVALHRAARERGEAMNDSDVAALRERVLSLLTRDGEIAVGMGSIMAPGVVAGPELRMEWWQQDSVRDVPAWLDVDLNPTSVDYYDYLSAEWFTVPRDTGQRHVVGPYVDVHGTGRYIVTLTQPVVDDGVFLGVAGADVPVARFETHVLRRLGGSPADIVVTNAERRVVMSSSPHWLTGALVQIGRAGATEHPAALDDTPVPWHLFVVRS
jgi:hypothetical protein